MNVKTPFKTLLMAAAVASPLTATAEFENTSYSYLGLGSEFVSYSETTNDFGGLEFESKFDGSNLVQKSGGYTAVGEKLGFFISTSSTLLAEESTEEWDFPAIGIVQKDIMSIKRTGIDILGVYHFQNAHFLNVGIHYNSVSFSRFKFSNTAFTDTLNKAVFQKYGKTQAEQDAALTAELNAKIAEAAAKNTCISNSEGDCIGTKNSDDTYTVSLDDYKEARKFNPEATRGVIFEDMTSWSLMAGWGYDSYFVRKKMGLRYLFAARVGAAVYESVLNTQNNRSLTRSFGGDWDFNLSAGIGYQLRPEFGVIASLEYNAVHRGEIRDGNVFLPTNDFQAVSPQITANWAF